MAADEPNLTDLKASALTTTTDFYALLSLPSNAPTSSIRRAYRKTALKYHPDKNADNPSAIETFHLLQIAHDILSTPDVREIYDNARRARQDKVEREALLGGARRSMKEDLERREAQGVKRKGEQETAELEEERELRRLAEDGRRRRMEMESRMRAKEMAREREEEEARKPTHAAPPVLTPQVDATATDSARTLTFRFRQSASTGAFTETYLSDLFTKRFGPIDHILLKSDRKIKVPGEKHRVLFTTVLIVFHDRAAATRAATESLEGEPWTAFEEVKLADDEHDSSTTVPPQQTNIATPKFSFKSPTATTSDNGSAETLEEALMRRLGEAEARRQEKKRTEAAATVALKGVSWAKANETTETLQMNE